jgi:tetratricopeptide (TPR) repeat protein
MSRAAENVADLQVALSHAAKLLDTEPALATEQAEEILRAAPGHSMAQLIAGIAARRMGDAARSLALLEPLAALQPKAPAVHCELGLTYGALGRGDAAIAALRRAVALKPDLADAWRALGDHLTAIGDTAGADAAYARQIKASTRDPRLLAPAVALQENKIAVAEALLRDHLKQHPSDVAALRMLAEVAGRLGRYADAELLLRRCLELAPSFLAARHNLALVLTRQNRAADALAEARHLLDLEPRNPGYRNLMAAIQSQLGEYHESIRLYEGVLTEYPRQPKVWMSYGHGLKTAARTGEAIEAYRKATAIAPQLGEAWWSLANLKTLRFEPDDLAIMRRQLARPDIGREDRFHLYFALGKALEDAARYEESFAAYAEANRLRHEMIRYDPDETTGLVQRSKTLLTQEFFAARAGAGCTARDPVFVVGLPRSGSTLIEQILSSHSQVEGTMELPDLPAMVRTLTQGDGHGAGRYDRTRYPGVLADLDRHRLRELGEEFLERTRIQRKTDAPFFIDKLPNNWQHVGLIHLMLPNARIIDARRHPLSGGFSVFKQHFARGQSFSFRLEDIGRYYRDYVELMAHFDTVLPGRVHRVHYESMVADTEREVRRLLDYCGLPFETACLRFHENERAVRTPSAEQVRQPIYTDALEQWRHYEPWLGPLRDALGPVLAAYPAAPAFADGSLDRMTGSSFHKSYQGSSTDDTQ